MTQEERKEYIDEQRYTITTTATPDGWKSDVYLAFLERWAPPEIADPTDRLQFIDALNQVIWQESLLAGATLKEKGDRMAGLLSKAKDLLIRAAGVLEDVAELDDHPDPIVSALALRAAEALGDGEDNDSE